MKTIGIDGEQVVCKREGEVLWKLTFSEVAMAAAMVRQRLRELMPPDLPSQIHIIETEDQYIKRARDPLSGIPYAAVESPPSTEGFWLSDLENPGRYAFVPKGTPLFRTR